MNQPDLRSRDQTILDAVVRYRLMTHQTLQRLVLPNLSLNAISKVTARLCRTQRLSRHLLIPPENYFRLGATGSSILGQSSRSKNPLGPQALPIDYATLCYCCLFDQKRRRLTQDELETYMPWLPEQLTHSPFCVDSINRLNLVRVDLGGSAQYVARKISRSIEKYQVVVEFNDMIAGGRFQISLLTTSEEKADAIAKSVASTGCPANVPVNLSVIPRLSLLLLQRL